MYFLFQDERTDETEVRKHVFISPFKRYKCVIPVIAEQEAEERKKQEKEEEEKQTNETDKKENIEQAEINESINRVHEHYMQISQSLSKEDQSFSKKKKKKSKLLLGQMHGRKRKRESDIAKDNENQERSDDSLSTPTPSLNAKIVHMSKNAKQEMQNAIEEQKLQETLAQVQEDRNTKQIKSIR